MKKICYVVTIPGTIESFFVPQLQFLAENGYSVTVVCSFSESLQGELGDKVTFHPIDIPRGISFAGSVKAIQELTAFFKLEQFDLIQYSTPNAAFYASIAAKAAGCKLRNYHLMGLRYLGAHGISRMILKTLEKIACYNSTSIECVSESNMQMGIREGLFPPEKVTVVWNGSSGGVDLERFDFAKRNQWRDEIRSELGFCNNDFVYGFVGRVTRDKGINELLEAYFSLNTDAKLLIVGPMDEIQTLDAQLMKKAQSHPNVLFHNTVTDIERYFAAIDVLMLPSYREGFGNVVIEAAAVGTPAIVSDIPGPMDAIDQEKTALVVPVKNVQALSEAMEKIRRLDIVQMGENAAAFSRSHFDSRELNKKIEERKKKLLGLQ